VRAGALARLAWLAATCPLLAGVPSVHAAPPAGTPIDNTATGSAMNAGGALPMLPSNTVRAVVQPREGVALYPDRGGLAAPGGSVTLAHRLVNTGNVSTDYRLDARDLPLDGFDAASFALVQDRNHDGVAGAGDTPIANGGVLTLVAGDSADVLLTLGVPANVPLGAIALARLTATGLAQGTTASVTDTLRTPFASTQPVLLFFDAGDYLRPTQVAGLGAPLEVEALARGCDADPTRVETVRITLRSRDTGDLETHDAVETAPHSGLFRFVPGAPTVSGARTSSSGDGVLSIVRGDQVSAELAGCGGTLTRSTVWIEPTGIVYGSRSDQPVGGVRVRLIDVSGAGNGGVPGGPASVLAGDGVTPSPAELTTDALGRFSFPLVRRSSYRLDVLAPALYRFPSRVGSAALPAGHFTDAAGSYGGTFTTADSLGPVLVDVPVDEVGTIALFVEQSASRPEVEWGDELDYTVQVANRSDSTLDSVTVREQLPPGFAYTRGTARGGLVTGSALGGGAPLADPAGAGPALAFAVGTLGPHAGFVLRLRAHVGSGAPDGEALAVAAADAGEVRSNPAPVRVRVRGDIFADEGGIVGVVRFSSGGAGGPAADAVGLAGVRLYLDDGTWAVTDGLGRFSFTGITPTTHALKLDRASLPPRSFPVAVDHRDQGTPGLRFVDLTRGELVHAEFRVEGDTAALRELPERHMIAARRDEATRALARAIEVPEQRAHTGDVRSLPAAAIVTGEREPGVGAGPAARAASAPAGTRSQAGAVIALEQLLPTLDPELGFVGIADLDTMPGTQIAVRVKGRLGTELALRVNGVRVPEARVGRRVTAATAGLEAWEYLGVTLQPGLNILELAPPHAAGRVAVRLVAPAAIARLELVGPRVAPADGRSPAVFTLSLADSVGVPVGARTLVTLESTLGRFGNSDLDGSTPGVQVAVEGGHAEVELYPPAAPGHAQLTAASGALRAAADVEFPPEMRPLLAVGMLEGVLTLDGVHGAPRGDGFQQPIGQFLSEARDGSASAGARGAVFMKGRVRDDVQMTLGYDSDRPSDLRQFRDMQVDRGYPVQGDASVRGYEAQSTGRLYARLDRHDASLLYGDLVTGGSGRSLANYARSLTGAAAAWGSDASGGRAFTSRARSHQAVDELPGRGVSGPYTLRHAPLLEGSERVEVLVRDRDQPAIVLSSEAKQRFTDYELDPISGRLLFRSPVPSFDALLNPVSVRVTYEVPEATTTAWVHGIELHQRMGPHLSVGGTYVDDHDPAQPLELRGASVLLHLAPRTTLEGEWAATHVLAGGSSTPGAGDAGRIEFQHDDPATQGRLWAMTSAPGFDNPGAGLPGGRTEAGGNLVTRLAERTRLKAEALYSGDAAGRTQHGGLLLSVDRTLSPAWRGELGSRISGETRASGASEPLVASVRARMLGQWPAHPEWSGYGEFEQDTRESARRMAALGGEYRFSARGRMYVRHELASSLDGAWSLSSHEQRLATVAGIDADLAHDAHMFSEYRLADALAGREAQAAVGLRNAWRLANAMRVGFSFERVNPLAGAPLAEGPSTALTGSVDWTEDPVWKGSARMEVRSSRATDQILQTMAAAVKLDTSWTALGRHALTLGGALTGDGQDAREDLELALAYRDPGVLARPAGRWDVLGRWELVYERDPALELRHRRVANVVGVNSTGRFPHGWSSTLAWAGKLTRDESASLITAGGAQWLHGRVLLDFAGDWDAGVSASLRSGRTLAERQYGLGIEFGRQLPANTWLSFGFNGFGYRDDELTGEEWTRTGVYLRVRARFDESLFRRSGGQP
jgi:uncharacterized repeat protein (TIGR01451 family)